MKKSFLFSVSFICVLAFTCFSSCNRSGSVSSGGNTSKDSAAGVESAVEKSGLLKSSWEKTNDRICVLFGYGYNSPEIIANITGTLVQDYGASEEGGLIMPIIFPDDFRRGERAVSSDLYELLSDCKENYNLVGIILLGAPENSSVALARFQDANAGKIDYATVSFFPQDDVLRTETTSDIVIERVQQSPENDDVVEVEYNQKYEDDISNILLATVKYILSAKKPIPQNTEIFSHVQEIISGHQVAHYVDAETGLRSINHFIFN